MKYLLFVFLYLNTNFLFSQETLSLFNDVFEGIQYITVDIHYNENEDFDYVTLNEEKTKVSIDSLEFFVLNNFVEFRKNVFGLELFYMDSLKNEKYKYSTVRLYNNNLKEFKVDDLKSCKKFKYGKYKYRSPLSYEVDIYRYENYQIEISEEHFLKYKIKWLSDCEYQLELVDTNDEDYEFQYNNIIQVEIIKTSDSDYLYKSDLNNHSTFGWIVSR